ncbi:MAG: type II toxin-antitoxin system HicB family antitoxin [Oscillospiraceae bacterium]|jgi:predicted RNase H-like HicB family nuclease|nr:type II toxin-antitoxin system HicB family antitoxin [Oscillospiraceae bacterium]
MLSNYPAVFLKDEANGGYVVNFPDFDCLTTEGDTLDEAIAMAMDALALRVFYADIDGYELPQPSDVKAVDADAVKAECEMQGCETFVNIISVNADEYAKAHFIKYVRKNVTLPEWLEQRAKEKKINFSLTLQKAIASELGVPLK